MHPIGTLQSDWRKRLHAVIETMQEMSIQTDPQEMVRAYGRRMQEIMPVAVRMSLSRRDLKSPQFRVTRYNGWEKEVNPWKQGHLLPVLEGGLLAELIYANQPMILDDFQVSPEDPAHPFLHGQRSLLALPLFDRGESLNMVVVAHTEPDYFDWEEIPERVWMSNLFGRATQNLVLAEKLDAAYQEVDRELKVVADIQRSLLPKDMPRISTLKLAAAYQTSRQAGGDYYDFFRLSDDRWGILIADVSGHGTPAAVVMAVLHCIAHMFPGEPAPPGRVLQFLNRELSSRYTLESGHFVTAFYGVYHPATKTLTYASAGHNPPRLRRCGSSAVTSLDGVRGLPLGIAAEVEYPESTQQLMTGDRLVFYTDGIVEASAGGKELFGIDRLDQAISRCEFDAEESLKMVLEDLQAFGNGHPADDDRTLIIGDIC